MSFPMQSQKQIPTVPSAHGASFMTAAPYPSGFVSASSGIGIPGHMFQLRQPSETALQLPSSTSSNTGIPAQLLNVRQQSEALLRTQLDIQSRLRQEEQRWLDYQQRLGSARRMMDALQQEGSTFHAADSANMLDLVEKQRELYQKQQQLLQDFQKQQDQTITRPESLAAFTPMQPPVVTQSALTNTMPATGPWLPASNPVDSKFLPESGYLTHLTPSSFDPRAAYSTSSHSLSAHQLPFSSAPTSAPHMAIPALHSPPSQPLIPPARPVNIHPVVQSTPAFYTPSPDTNPLWTDITHPIPSTGYSSSPLPPNLTQHQHQLPQPQQQQLLQHQQQQQLLQHQQQHQLPQQQQPHHQLPQPHQQQLQQQQQQPHHQLPQPHQQQLLQHQPHQLQQLHQQQHMSSTMMYSPVSHLQTPHLVTSSQLPLSRPTIPLLYPDARIPTLVSAVKPGSQSFQSGHFDTAQQTRPEPTEQTMSATPPESVMAPLITPAQSPPQVRVVPTPVHPPTQSVAQPSLSTASSPGTLPSYLPMAATSAPTTSDVASETDADAHRRAEQDYAERYQREWSEFETMLPQPIDSRYKELRYVRAFCQKVLNLSPPQVGRMRIQELCDALAHNQYLIPEVVVTTFPTDWEARYPCVRNVLSPSKPDKHESMEVSSSELSPPSTLSSPSSLSPPPLFSPPPAPTSISPSSILKMPSTLYPPDIPRLPESTSATNPVSSSSSSMPTKEAILSASSVMSTGQTPSQTVSTTPNMRDSALSVSSLEDKARLTTSPSRPSTPSVTSISSLLPLRQISLTNPIVISDNPTHSGPSSSLVSPGLVERGVTVPHGMSNFATTSKPGVSVVPAQRPSGFEQQQPALVDPYYGGNARVDSSRGGRQTAPTYHRTESRRYHDGRRSSHSPDHRSTSSASASYSASLSRSHTNSNSRSASTDRSTSVNQRSSSFRSANVHVRHHRSNLH